MSLGSELDQLVGRVTALEAEVAGLLAERAEETDRVRQRWLDARQAAEYIGVSVQRVRNLTREQRVPFNRDGRRVLYDRVALDRWMEAKAIEPE